MTTTARLPPATRGPTIWPVSLLLLPVLAAVVLLGSSGAAPRRTSPGAAAGFGVTRTADGLLAADAFDRARPRRALEDIWEPDPLAPRGLATYAATGGGLRVGVDSHKRGTWEGYFLVTRAMFPATAVFHTAARGDPARVDGLDSDKGEVVFAVQTGSTKVTGDINFVAVSSLSFGGDLDWQVGYSEGRFADARLTTYVTMEDVPPDLDVAEPVGITLRTDGRRSFTVYLDDRLVLDRHDLDMRIDPPFQPYLEVQAESSGYTSVFTDFWVTRSDTVALTGLPSGTEAALVAGGPPPARAAAGRAGRALRGFPGPTASGAAELRLRVPGRSRGVTAVRGLRYAGGDSYRVEVGRGGR